MLRSSNTAIRLHWTVPHVAPNYVLVWPLRMQRMTRKTNIDWYWERLEVLEKEFGAKWLAKKSRDPSFGHPIPRLWAEAVAMLQAAQRSRRLPLSEELAGFFDPPRIWSVRGSCLVTDRL